MSRTIFRILVGSTAFAGVLLSGCMKEAPEPTLEELAALEPRYNSTGSVVLNGRPVDLDAAVRWSVSQVEPGLAVVNITTPNPWEREYELLSVLDEQGWLMIRTPDDSPISLWSQVSQRLIAHAKIGRFDKREQTRERELLRVLNGRLEALAGNE
ncbi:MAG: hypothetical protein ACIAQF_10830 [Phycisphaerales bacterium JB065]